ncbi:MAG: periplasmic heavy metal sensor [Acidobacteriota bacterium]|nr:periplasmic heavy metal sensor [Acidobacteriota bacterium]
MSPNPTPRRNNALSLARTPWVVGVLALLLVAGALALPLSTQAQPPFQNPNAAGPGAGLDQASEGFTGELLVRAAARFLELTEDQQEQTVALLMTARDAAQPLVEEQRGLRMELRDLLSSDNPDATAVGTLVLDLQSGRQDLGAIKDTFESDFRALLTEEQIVRLDAFQAARRFLTVLSKGGRRGAGGDGGGGPEADF